MRLRVRLALLFGAAAASLAVVTLIAAAQPIGDQAGNQNVAGRAAAAAPPVPPLTLPTQSGAAEAPTNSAGAPGAALAGQTNSLEATNSLAAAPPLRPPPRLVPPPPSPAPPARASAAVLQALDKVTAETIRFEAPVGKPIRYKNLVFIVKACETNGLGQAEPQSQAYVVIDFAPLRTDDVAPPPPRRLFRGWMFANSPSLNPFRQPNYDAWLISCTDQAPPG